MTAKTTAAHRLVETLAVNGVTHVFCVPGESYLAVLDAFVDFQNQIKVVTCRHESGAANMAVAYGKLTGKPGICFVTRGPGATQGAVGVHTAKHDSVPLILFIGQVASDHRGREAFQELDYQAVFGSFTKFVGELDDPTRTVELVSRAFSAALQGRMGPTVISLPEDTQEMDAGPRAPEPVRPAPLALDARVVAEVIARLEKAERPLLLLGGSGWSDEARKSLTDWVAAARLPVVLNWRRKDLFDNDHPCYAGDLNLRLLPEMKARLKASDLIGAIGARLSEAPTQGYTLFTPEETARKLVHILPDIAELNSVWPTAVSGAADPSAVVAALTGHRLSRSWKEWTDTAHRDYLASIAPIAVTGKVNLREICAHLNEALPADAIVCNGGGNYAAWLQRYYRHRSPRTHLSPTSGAMGFGFPAGIAAKMLYPERDVVVMAGDGCFMMAAQELATAVQYGVNVVTVVVDNGSYGTIRMHQERDYPNRVMATDLHNPDFAGYADVFGAWGTMVDRTEDFPAALAAARKARKPAIIHLNTDVEDILPGQRLSKMKT
jgi:acetolactate synthase-1/2/3 large subunit